MQLITAAYFREGDFDQVSILEEAFHNLNACLVPELLTTPEAFVGNYWNVIFLVSSVFY
jgi:hypothetical protein